MIEIACYDPFTLNKFINRKINATFLLKKVYIIVRITFYSARPISMLMKWTKERKINGNTTTQTNNFIYACTQLV